MTDRRVPIALLVLAAAASLGIAAAMPAPSAAQPAPQFVLSRPVSTTPPEVRVPAFGRVISNPAGQLDINAAISGQVAEVLVLPGSVVGKGDPIATVTSPDFVFTQRSYLALLENDLQLEILRGEGNLPNYLSDARDNLRWWGMTEAQIDRLVEERRTIDRLNLVAPEDGIITEVLVQPGDMIDAGDRTMQSFIVLGRAVARMQRAAMPLTLEISVFPDLELGPPEPLVTADGPGSVSTEAATPPGGGIVGDEPDPPPTPDPPASTVLMDGFNAPATPPPSAPVEAALDAPEVAPDTASATLEPTPPADSDPASAADDAGLNGDPRFASGPAAQVRLPLPGTDGEPITLPVALVAPAIDAVSQQARGLVSLEGVPGDLQLGQVIPIEIVQPGTPGVWVPADAVLSPDIAPTVFVDEGEGRYNRRPMTIVERVPGWFRAEGIAPDERVVIRGKTILEGEYRRVAGGASDDDHHH